MAVVHDGRTFCYLAIQRMILNLDHNQRLHLIGALDRLESVGRRDGFAVCRLQERLELTDQEREAIGWRKMNVNNGQEFVSWNNNNGLPAKEYDLSEDDIKRLCNAIDKYPVVLGRDKHWWVPLTAQLPQPVAEDLIANRD